MRISLLKPPRASMTSLDMITLAEPLGLECIAGALLADGHECQIVDLRIDGVPRGIAKLRQFGPGLIGIQCNFTTERFQIQRLCRFLHVEFPDALIVIGGHDASRDPEWFQQPEIGAVVLGEGEATISALVRAWEDGTDLREVTGLMLNTSNGPLYTATTTERMRADDLPFPARNLIREYADQYYINIHRPLALLETARGCPYRCQFCSVWKFHQGTYRQKSPERVIQELEQIRAPYVFITDDIFWINAEHSQALAHMIQSRGLHRHFFVQTRSDLIVRFPHLVELWKGCGGLTVFLGFEKLDDAGLQSVNKQNMVANNDRALGILKELGVAYTPNFIIDPGWNPSDFARLHHWLDQTGAYNSAFTILTPLPGTELWDTMQTELVTRNWELFDLEHAVTSTSLPLERFYQEYASLWNHTRRLRIQMRGRSHGSLRLLKSLMLGKVSLGALLQGIQVARLLGQPMSYLSDHRHVRPRGYPDD